jgi:hypothetical protein
MDGAQTKHTLLKVYLPTAGKGMNLWTIRRVVGLNRSAFWIATLNATCSTTGQALSQ